VGALCVRHRNVHSKFAKYTNGKAKKPLITCDSPAKTHFVTHMSNNNPVQS